MNTDPTKTGGSQPRHRDLLFRHLWNRTDYSWLPRFLDSRGLVSPGRIIVASWCLLLALVSITMQLSRFGAGTGLARAVLVIVAASGLYAGYRWFRTTSWPSWTESIAFVAWADVWLALALFFALRTPIMGTFGCIIFIIIGFYVAAVHSPLVAAVHIGWALAVCTTLAVRSLMDPANDDWIIINVYLMICAVIFSTVYAFQVLWLRLTEDARHARLDYLTATFNRRGLEDETYRLLREDPAGTQALIALLIDIDAFKRLNDTHGHTAGDGALTSVADRLTAAAGAEAVVARLGGDEFVVLRRVDTQDIEQVAERIHSAITSETDSNPVSASTGVSVYLPTDTDPPDRIVSLLIAHADNAMYRAKKRGGNRIAWVQMRR